MTEHKPTVPTINSAGYEVPPEIRQNIAITTLDKIWNMGRRYSVWPMMFG